MPTQFIFHFQSSSLNWSFPLILFPVWFNLCKVKSPAYDLYFLGDSPRFSFCPRFLSIITRYYSAANLLAWLRLVSEKNTRGGGTNWNITRARNKTRSNKYKTGPVGVLIESNPGGTRIGSKPQAAQEKRRGGICKNQEIHPMKSPRRESTMQPFA